VSPHLPKAVLLDLDDTILDDSGGVQNCWRDACTYCVTDINGIEPGELLQTIERTREWFWSDPVRHRQGRLDLDGAARKIAAQSLAELGVLDPAVAAKIAMKYRSLRDEGQQLFPDAVETLRWLRERGCRLALVTNGSAALQRSKLERFGLAELFESILIEGELGFGKPDTRIYTRALQELTVAAADSWMVGDNLEWDVAQPQKLGLVGIWVDLRGVGLPETNTICPDRIVRGLSELRPWS
jgi:putative hydrolase of the HAD superfamily